MGRRAEDTMVRREQVIINRCPFPDGAKVASYTTSKLSPSIELFLVIRSIFNEGSER